MESSRRSSREGTVYHIIKQACCKCVTVYHMIKGYDTVYHVIKGCKGGDTLATRLQHSCRVPLQLCKRVASVSPWRRPPVRPSSTTQDLNRDPQA